MQGIVAFFSFRIVFSHNLSMLVRRSEEALASEGEP